MTLDPSAATSPLAQAPPDRPSLGLEQWARQGLALLLGDNKIDDQEMRVVRNFFQTIQTFIANGGAIGQGAPPTTPDGAPAQSPMEMNSQTEDMGTVEGAEPENPGDY